MKVCHLPPLVLALLVGCHSPPPEPESRKPSQLKSVSSAAPTSKAAPTTPTAKPRPMFGTQASAEDPLKGKFTIEDATKDLPGAGKQFIAELDTELGTLSCELYAEKAPNTVANFIGLARGLRDWKSPDGQWVKQPAYDGTTFHRVVKGFMIQGGDPTGTGAGQPGYVIPDEIWEGSKHDQRGLLCMANRGPNTNGAQFFVMDGPALHLTRAGTYTIFGKCSPDAVIEKLASVEVRGDQSVKPTKIKKVTIKRK